MLKFETLVWHFSWSDAAIELNMINDGITRSPYFLPDLAVLILSTRLSSPFLSLHPVLVVFAC